MSDYPSSDDLRFIKEFDLLKNHPDLLLECLKNIWHWGEPYFSLKGKRILRLELHTGGWSGNEEIIAALEKNFIFWTMYWKKHEVGGHYYFRIKPIKKGKKK